MRISLAAALLFLTAASAGAQPAGDFSGTWSLPADAPPGPSGKPVPAPGFGPQINIVQHGNSVIISKIVGGQPVHVVHPLDGSESQSRTPGGLCKGDAQATWTATRTGDVIDTAMTGWLAAGASAPTKSSVRTSFRLTSPDTLVVELTVPSPSGTAPQTRSTTYKKTGPPTAVPAAPAPAPVQATIAQIDWLGGTWIGTTGTNAFEERWTPPSGGSMLAVARSLRNAQMNSFEFLCIVERNGGLVYQAMPNGRQPATDFTLTQMEGRSLRFENPAHDFPKAITYTLQADGTLEAVISGTEKQKPQTFRFKRQ